MEIALYQVDAFTSELFAGNPAAVCPLESWLDDRLLQQIAAENNLSETAFFVEGEDGYELRWFTPKAEVELCGHATLASAHVLLRELGIERERLIFLTQSGRLGVQASPDNDRLVIDLPAQWASPTIAPQDLVEALHIKPLEVLRSGHKFLVVVASAAQVLDVAPDFGRLASLGAGVIVTAAGVGCDFVSRFFAPHLGIAEDPVTGAAHCVLVPYWAERLGQSQLHARQISQRGGELYCELLEGRVLLAGQAVTYLRGMIDLPVD